MDGSFYVVTNIKDDCVSNREVLVELEVDEWWAS